MDFFRTTHLTKPTATTYNSKINKWISLMPPHKNTLSYIFLHPNFSVVTLRQFLSKNDTDTAPTLNSYIKAILSATEHNSDLFNNISDQDYTKSENRWKDLRQKTYEYANQYRLEQKPSPSQSLKSGSALIFTDIVKVRDELEDGSIDKLLLSFYTYIPPVRADFFSTQLLNFNETPSYPNYIFYNDSKAYLKITDFKTSPIYKSIEYELPDELHRQLILSLSQYPRTLLFPNKDGKSFTRKTFSEWATKKLTALFKKEFTLTMFRHIYISTLDLNTSPAKLLEISNKMGHSLTQQMLYNWKEHPENIDSEIV
jgi:hypothetical protein